MTVSQHTPNSSATRDTGRASSPTWRAASNPARWVITCRAGNAGCASVYGLAAQSSSTQRHRRFNTRSRTGRPKHAKSRTSTGRRSWDSARMPHLEHPTTVAVVSTVTVSSSAVSATSRTRKPSRPNSFSASPLPSTIVRGLRCRSRRTSHDDGMAPDLKPGLSTKPALRDEPWLAASYSADGLSMPFEAVTSDDAAPVVVDVSESVGLSSGLFDEHVGVLGSAVGGSAGAVVGEDQLGPATDSHGEATEFWDVGVGAEDIEGDHAAAGVGLVDGGEHFTQQLLGDEAGCDLPVGVADRQQ